MKTFRTGLVGLVIFGFGLVLVPNAWAAVAGTASRWVANLLTFQGSSGNNAWEFATNGLRADFGTGASDYASSDGTTVTFAGPLASVDLTMTGASGQVYFSSTSALAAFISNISAANATATNAAIKIYTTTVLTATDLVLSVGDQNNTTKLFGIAYNGATIMPATDQSADCDNAATGNAAVGKVCVGAGQGSMTLTNSLVTSSTLVQLTNVSDDTTCLSGYATVGSGSVVIGCVGAATATANTVFSFRLYNQ